MIPAGVSFSGRLSKLCKACRVKTDTIHPDCNVGSETVIARQKGKENICLKPR